MTDFVVNRGSTFRKRWSTVDPLTKLPVDLRIGIVVFGQIRPEKDSATIFHTWDSAAAITGGVLLQNGYFELSLTAAQTEVIAPNYREAVYQVIMRNVVTAEVIEADRGVLRFKPLIADAP